MPLPGNVCLLAFEAVAHLSRCFPLQKCWVDFMNCRFPSRNSPPHDDRAAERFAEQMMAERQQQLGAAAQPGTVAVASSAPAADPSQISLHVAGGSAGAGLAAAPAGAAGVPVIQHYDPITGVVHTIPVAGYPQQGLPTQLPMQQYPAQQYPMPPQQGFAPQGFAPQAYAPAPQYMQMQPMQQMQMQQQPFVGQQQQMQMQGYPMQMQPQQAQYPQQQVVGFVVSHFSAHWNLKARSLCCAVRSTEAGNEPLKRRWHTAAAVSASLAPDFFSLSSRTSFSLSLSVATCCAFSLVEFSDIFLNCACCQFRSLP